jgi:hypothetical protein
MLGLAQVEGGRVVLARLVLRHPLLGGAALQQLVSRHYTRAALPQLFKLAASADVFGAPPCRVSEAAGPVCMASGQDVTVSKAVSSRPSGRPALTHLHVHLMTNPATAQATRGGCCTTWAWACGPSWRSRRQGCCAPPAAGGSAACPRCVTPDAMSFDTPHVYHIMYHIMYHMKT